MSNCQCWIPPRAMHYSQWQVADAQHGGVELCQWLHKTRPACHQCLGFNGVRRERDKQCSVCVDPVLESNCCAC